MSRLTHHISLSVTHFLTQVTTEAEPNIKVVSSEPLPIWVIIVASGAGLLILIIIILIMWKVS